MHFPFTFLWPIFITTLIVVGSIYHDLHAEQIELKHKEPNIVKKDRIKNA